MSRDLAARGHSSVGIDISPAMVESARGADPSIEVHLADAASLPFPDGAFDLVVAFMSLEVTFVSEQRPLEAYTDALTSAGLRIERLREPRLPEQAVTVPRNRRWQRLPLFLHMRAVKAGPGNT